MLSVVILVYPRNAKLQKSLNDCFIVHLYYITIHFLDVVSIYFCMDNVTKNARIIMISFCDTCD